MFNLIILQLRKNGNSCQIVMTGHFTYFKIKMHAIVITHGHSDGVNMLANDRNYCLEM